jgi:hypothetical protein
LLEVPAGECPRIAGITDCNRKVLDVKKKKEQLQ